MQILDAIIEICWEFKRPQKLREVVEIALEKRLIIGDASTLEDKAINAILEHQKECESKGLLPFIEYFPDNGFCRPLNFYWNSLSDEQRFMRSKHAKRKELMERVRSLDDYEFQIFCTKLLEKFGFQNCRISDKRTRDKGIDFLAELHFDFVNVTIVGQAKRYSEGTRVSDIDVKNLDSTVRQEQLKRLREHPIKNELFMGLLITTSKFTKPAMDYVRYALTPLKLIDIDELILRMINYNIGFTTLTYPEASLDTRHPLEWFTANNRS